MFVDVWEKKKSNRAPTEKSYKWACAVSNTVPPCCLCTISLLVFTARPLSTKEPRIPQLLVTKSPPRYACSPVNLRYNRWETATQFSRLEISLNNGFRFSGCGRCNMGTRSTDAGKWHPLVTWSDYRSTRSNREAQIFRAALLTLLVER